MEKWAECVRKKEREMGRKKREEKEGEAGHPQKFLKVGDLYN